MDSSILKSRNTQFSKFSGLDLQELLANIEATPLIYRDILNLDSNLFFGLEIEWEGKNYSSINEFINKNMPKWQLVTDGSLNSGGEIRSPRIHDSSHYWKKLKEVCEFLKKRDAIISERTGGHIHFGANIFGQDLEAFLVFLKTYAIYENIFFRFYYGEFLLHRESRYTKSQKLAWTIESNLDKIKSIDDLNDKFVFLRRNRDAAINFSNLKFGSDETNKNTIELRIPNGTIEEIIWQNNVNAFGKFILKTIGDKIDRDYIDYMFLNITEKSLHPILYNEICLLKSLEFVDLIFDNDLDKYYFLKQYFKNYENNYGLSENRLAKRFIR